MNGFSRERGKKERNFPETERKGNASDRNQEVTPTGGRKKRRRKVLSSGVGKRKGLAPMIGKRKKGGGARLREKRRKKKKVSLDIQKNITAERAQKGHP